MTYEEIPMPHPDAMRAGFLFARMLVRPDFREYLARIGAPRACPVVVVIDNQDPKITQSMIDTAFGEAAKSNDMNSDMVLLVKLDVMQPFGLRIEKYTFQQELCNLHRELNDIIGGT